LRDAKDANLIMRGVHEQIKANLQASLNAIFPEVQPHPPMDVLTEYLTGAMESLINWWMANRTVYDALQLATMLHHLRRAVICDAYKSEWDE
jgi:hypothetical protein